ncbi:conserved phage C-terminal domain-containing protein [Paenibacillus sp. RS8]|uniref:conserved phage C-terminal domain-containing protein n=1 Tax=Paenibacillus sp. RS8 TaxID=3242681 RepID=UPI0035BF7A6E
MKGLKKMSNIEGNIAFETGFFIGPNEIFDRDDAGTHVKIVFLYLCRCANNSTVAFPSYNTIAAKCSMSRRKAIECVEWLVENKLLEKIIRRGEEKNGSNLYKIIRGGAPHALGGAQHAPDVVHSMHQGGAPHAPDVVHSMHQGGAPHAPYKELYINNHNINNHLNNTLSGKPDEGIPEQVIAYLNDRTGSHYKSSTGTTTKLINARVKEGRSLEDFKTVINKKVASWKGTDREQYLRPSTLFRPGNFEAYLNEPWPKGVNRGATDQPSRSDSGLNQFVIE